MQQMEETMSTKPWRALRRMLLLAGVTAEGLQGLPALGASDPVTNNGALDKARNLPTGCYTIRRTERTGFGDYYTGARFIDPADQPGGVQPPYSPPMISREDAYADIVTNHAADILCIGDTIAIHAPLRSNGGNIFILANRLDVRAPIDSRVYFDIGRRARYYRNSVTIGAPYENFFASYYRDNPEAVVLGGATYAPELPSGATIQLPEGFGTANGSPPPLLTEPDRGLAQSGAIVIFAKSYSVADALTHGVAPISAICAGPNASPNFAFQAGGLRGGKGGMGSPPGCSRVNHSGGSSCADELYVNSGLSAPPGAGGDAGSVGLYRIGAPFSSAELARLQQATNVTGGPPGPAAIYRTLDAREVDAQVSDNICARQPVGNHPAAAAGTAGAINVGTATILEALERADAFALSTDARPSMDMRDLVERAREDVRVEYRSMEEFERSTLSRIALAANRLWALQLARQVAGQPVSEVPSVEPFAGMRAALTHAPYPMVSPSISGLVQRLGKLDTVPAGNLASAYFSGTSGAFSVANPDATAAINGKLVVDTLAEVVEASAEQLRALNGVELALNQQLYVARQQMLLAKLAAVQQRIAEIEALPAKTGASFGDLVSVIQKAQPAISAFVGAVAAGDVMGAGQAYGDAIKGITDIYNTAFGEVANGAPKPGIVELRAAMAALNRDLRDLDAAYSSERESLLTARYTYAERELGARHRVVTRLDGRLPYGEDLIKHSFVAYYLDPQRDKAVLIENLNESAIFLSGKTDYTSNLRLPPLYNRCEIDANGNKSNAACLVLPSSTQYRFVETEIPGAFRFPAWIVSPRNGDTIWPTFDARMRVTKVRSLDEAARYGKRR
ncbi:hypothetical protein SB751_20360 [Cupriavidus sp. SIMBA_020]|uniref:hypothetical protein n=2 Tax=Pseudomonadota TaxID=1224 RepID=UPI00397E4C2B